jgi:hypothetical protein
MDIRFGIMMELIVRRIFFDERSDERIVLGSDRSEAEKIILRETERTGGREWSSSFMYCLDFPFYSSPLHIGFFQLSLTFFLFVESLT